MSDTLPHTTESQEQDDFNGFRYTEGFTYKDDDLVEAALELTRDEATRLELFGAEALRHAFLDETSEGEHQKEADASYTDNDESHVPWLSAKETWLTPDAHINLSDEEARDDRNVLDAMERQHYARLTPRNAEQAEDTTRTNMVESKRFASGSEETVTTTEHDGLQQFRAALKEKIAQGNEYSEELQDMLDNLTFIGEKELAEGAHGIGLLWKDFLDQDERNVLCLGAIGLSAQEGKSSHYVTDRVLDTLSDEDLARFSGRIVKTPEELVATGVDPNHALIVFTDDSTISGRQLRERYDDMRFVPGIEPYLKSTIDEMDGPAFLKHVEIHLIVGDAWILEEGLRTNDAAGSKIPTKAYYKAHEVDTEDSVHEGLHSRKTAAHSSMDFGFNWTILPAFGSQSEMPPLAYIKRQYREMPSRVVIEPDGTLRRA